MSKQSLLVLANSLQLLSNIESIQGLAFGQGKDAYDWDIDADGLIEQLERASKSQR